MEMFFLGLISGVALAWLIIRFIVEHAIAKVQKELGPEFDRVIDKMERELEQADTAHDKIFVTLEQHQNSYMVYLAEGSQFLTQGADYNSVIKNLEKIYPESRFEIVGGDTDAIQTFMASGNVALTSGSST